MLINNFNINGFQNSNSYIQSIAEKLHEKFCHRNHTDGCAYPYENDDWDRTEHDLYYKKAEKLYDFAFSKGVDVFEIIDLLVDLDFKL